MENSSYTRIRTNSYYIREHFSLLPSNHGESDDDIDDVDESLQVLLKKTWNIYGVSLLFGFDYQNERNLKLYGKRLREEVASILPHDNVTYDVEFTIDENISYRPIATDPPAIRIEVHTKSTEKEDLNKCIYTGILLSWRTSLGELDYGKSVKLPLLLCRGTKSTMAAVHLTLRNMFDCLIIELPATEDDLRWLVPVILQPKDIDEPLSLGGQVKFEYKIPGLLISNGISVKYDTANLLELWNVICDSNDDIQSENGISFKHVEKFHEVLQYQMLHGAGMQLGLGKLNKISFPSLTIMDNKIKSNNTEVLHKVLLFLNEKAIEVLYTLSLDSTVSTNSVAS